MKPLCAAAAPFASCDAFGLRMVPRTGGDAHGFWLKIRSKIPYAESRARLALRAPYVPPRRVVLPGPCKRTYARSTRGFDHLARRTLAPHPVPTRPLPRCRAPPQRCGGNGAGYIPMLSGRVPFASFVYGTRPTPFSRNGSDSVPLRERYIPYTIIVAMVHTLYHCLRTLRDAARVPRYTACTIIAAPRRQRAATRRAESVARPRGRMAQSR